jgi:hypothetical protein
MDPHRVRPNLRSKGITSSGNEFRFRPGTRGSSREYGSTRLGPKTKRGGTSESTSSRGEDSSYH